MAGFSEALHADLSRNRRNRDTVRPGPVESEFDLLTCQVFIVTSKKFWAETSVNFARWQEVAIGLGSKPLIRNLSFIEYNVDIKVHKSLLNVILHD